MGVYVNDLNLHDSSRELILAGTQQSAELQLALDQVSPPSPDEEHHPDKGAFSSAEEVSPGGGFTCLMSLYETYRIKTWVQLVLCDLPSAQNERVTGSLCETVRPGESR